MEKFSMLSQLCTLAYPHRRIRREARLFLFLLLATGTSSAWPVTTKTGFVTPENTAVPEKLSKSIGNIDAYPEVVVFPIHVASIDAVDPSRQLANKLAQASEVPGIAVIYPDIGEPYRSVFTQIIDGIEAKAMGRVANFAVGPNVNINELKSSLHNKDTKVVIALGRQGMKIAAGLDSDIGVVVGGVFSNTEDGARALQVNSLTPDPALLFSRLKKIMPAVRRVFTVYDPRQNDWLMRLAKQSAATQGLELLSYQAQDLRSAMQAYQKIMASADSDQDALWLPQDSTTVEESTIMPFVLQESWTNNLAVFSSSFAHVKRGVLFSLYPDNVELGRHLAGNALDILASGRTADQGIFPLREVLMAVNLRTAKHLGLNTNHLQSSDMTFPEQ
jgi:putative ABC transport system substrate-binding protein